MKYDKMKESPFVALPRKENESKEIKQKQQNENYI